MMVMSAKNEIMDLHLRMEEFSPFINRNLLHNIFYSLILSHFL